MHVKYVYEVTDSKVNETLLKIKT